MHSPSTTIQSRSYYYLQYCKNADSDKSCIFQLNRWKNIFETLEAYLKVHLND